MITIPDVKGKSLRETKNKFDDWGLRYDQVKEIYSFNTEKGKVVKCDPQIGSQVNYGDLITIYISKGKTYPIFIVLFAFLLVGLLLGRGTISRLIEDSKKKPQTANVCLLNCDTNGDGIADTNLDTDGDGICDTNCDSPVEQNGDGTSKDGKTNENPKESKPKEDGNPTIKVVTENQGTNTVVKVVETKNSDVIKYENGNKKIEYFTSGNGQTIAIGEYVIIGNTGTITIYAGNGSGGGTTTQIDTGNNNSGSDPMPVFEISIPNKYSNRPQVKIEADSNVYTLKVLKGSDKDLADVKNYGKEITGKSSYYLCDPENTDDAKAACTGTWTFAAWSKSGRGRTETVTFNKFDNDPPVINIHGDFLTPKKTVTAIVEATDNYYNNSNNYFTYYYTKDIVDPVELISSDYDFCSDTILSNCKYSLTNGEYLGINTNGTYTFVVMDQAGNYDSKNITISNADNNLSVPVFTLSNNDWTTDKTITITYPSNGLGTSEYSIDGGVTWNTYMDPIHFTDDGTVHEIIARVMYKGESITANSIVINKIDNTEPKFKIDVDDNREIALGKDKNVAKLLTNNIKSGYKFTCKYSNNNDNIEHDIENFSSITKINEYNFKCSVITGSGKTYPDQRVNNVEVYKSIDIIFNAGEGIYDNDICDSIPNCTFNNSNNSLVTKNLHEGSSIGVSPIPSKDGYSFEYWYRIFDGVEESLDQSSKPTETQEYYAKWSIGNFTITFDGNGGLWNGNETITKKVQNGANLESTLATLQQPIKSDGGETFVGWYDSPEGGNQITSSYTPTRSITVYARWLSNVGSDFSSYLTQLYNSGAYSSVLSNIDGKNIRYISTSANNYVDLDGNGTADYRIIGVIQVKKASGANANLVKLVSINSIGKHVIDANGSAFESSTLKNTLQALDVAQYAESVYWSTASITSTSTISDALEKEYLYEKTYTGKVGMLYASDIGYSRGAGSNPKINRISSATSSWMLSGSNYVNKATYVLDSSEQEGYPYFAYDPTFVITPVQSSLDLDIFPVIYLKEGTKVNGGNGSASTPFGIINN